MNEENSTPGSYWLMQPLIFAVLLAGGFAMGAMFQSNGGVQVIKSERSKSASSGSYEKLGEILNFIQTKYVDSVDVDHLADVAARAMLKELDPNSYYISRADAVAVNNRMQGNLDGIGIEFFVFQDTVHIIDVLADGPAENAELKRGDVILAVNDSVVSGHQRELGEIIEIFRGESGTVARIEVLRPSTGEISEINVQRGSVPLSSVGASYMIEDDLLYVKLNSFTSRTYREFMESIESSIVEGETIDLVLDLRHNPGGYLQEAIKILSQLFPRAGTELVKTRGSSIQERVYKSSGQQFFRIGKIAVLIDGASASASEIIAGVVQDLDRAIVVGTESYGKGSVQEHYRLRDESAIRLTVSRYFIPSGRSIYKKDRDEYYKGEFTDGSFDADRTYFTDNGREVFEGQAIRPDIIVESDSFFTHSSFADVMLVVNRLAFVYYRDLVNSKTADIQSFEDVQIPARWKQDFQKLAEAEFGDTELLYKAKENPERVGDFLRARMARYFFGENGYYQVLNQTDPVVLTAREALYGDYQAMLEK
jgi:carboxyl-terminal processing protease